MDPLPITGPQSRPEPQEVPSAGEENLLRDRLALVPGTPNAEIKLSEEANKVLSRELMDVLVNYDSSMQGRVDRWSQIDDAYNLVADEATVGDMPYAQRVVSEMTRSHVNIATARLEEQVLGTRPFALVHVWDDQADDQDTQELVEEAKASETFFDSYFMTAMRAEQWLPMTIHRAVKLGGAVVRVKWEEKPRTYWYKDKRGKRQKKVDRQGGIAVDMIPNEQAIFWPLHWMDVSTIPIAGHRSYESPASFRALARTLDLSDETVRKVEATVTTPDDFSKRRLQQNDLMGKDISLTELSTMVGEVPVTELWLTNYVLPGENEPGNYQVFLSETLQEVLWIGINSYAAQRHGYFLFPYWIEDSCIWPSGVGHELLYPQKADSAMWAMMLDNLKVIGNVLRIVKSGQMAESLQDEIRPGGTIVTEDPNEDFKTAQLGGDLSWLLQAIQMNTVRGMKSDGLTNPEQGMADPVLKSGASPGSIQQLREASGKRFGKIDKNMRLPLSDLCLFCLEMLQQMAPPDMYYAKASQASAQKMIRAKYRVPSGDLRSKFRITVKAPSATSNEEVRNTRLMLTYQLMGQYLPLFFQLVDTTMGQSNPAGAQSLKENWVRFFNNGLVRQLIESQEIAGLAGEMPMVEDATPADEQLNQAIEVIQQLQAQMAQMNPQMQGGMDAAQGGGGPGGLAPPVS